MLSPLYVRSRSKNYCFSVRKAATGLALFAIITIGPASVNSAWAQEQKQGDQQVNPARKDVDQQVPPAKVDLPTTTASKVDAATVVPVQAIKFRERPKYISDPQRLRRTPTIDGVLNDGEWDPFYTIDDGLIKGTVYCNWDDRFLYLAAKTDVAATVLFDIDAGGDGWLRGSDNMEVVVGPPTVIGGAPTVSVRLLDASNSKDTPTWNETGVDPKTIVVAEKVVGGSQILEIAIPKNAGSLVLRPGVTMGVRAEFMPPSNAAAFIPTQPFEPHLLLDATLVEARVVAAQGLNPRLTLSDYKCVAGQKLFGTLELFNQTDILVRIKSVTWGGEGNSLNTFNTLRDVSVPPIPGLKRSKIQYKTVLPDTLPLGSYILNVSVETEEGKRVQSSASIVVVEPIQVQMSAEPNPLAIIGPTKLEVKVDVQSAVPDHWRGDVELTTYPAGWEIRNGRKHSLLVERQDAHAISTFNLQIPSNTAAGTYPLEAVVTWKGRTWKVRTVVNVIRTDAPVKPAIPTTPAATGQAPPSTTPPASQ